MGNSASTVADETKVEKETKWWRFPYGAPGKVEEYNREARMMAPDTFAGFRAEYNRLLGGGEHGEPELLVTHLATISPPKAMALGGGEMPLMPRNPLPQMNHMLAAQLSAGPIAFMGRVDRSRRVFGTVTFAPRGCRALTRAVLQAQTHPNHSADETEPTEMAAELCGSPIHGSGTTHVKLQREGGVVAVGHMQQVSRNVAVGAEVVHVHARAFNGLSCVTRVMLPKIDAVIGALFAARPVGLDVSYVQQMSRNVRVSTEINFGHNPDTGKVDSTAGIGWEYRAGDSMLVRGKLDKQLALAVSVEESLGNMFRVALSADLDFRSHSYIWGFGLQVSS